MLFVPDLSDGKYGGMDLRGIFLLDHGGDASEPGDFIWTMAAHLWNRCFVHLCHEAPEKNPVLLFGLCVTITGVVEYVIGFVGINLLDLRLWDYRGLFLNVNGIICFRSVVSFGVMGLLFHYLLEPMAERMVKKANPDTIQNLCLVLLFLFLTDCVLSALFRTPITY